MKLDKVKEAFSSVFEEDEALKYALATNIAKYGRPQSKPSDKPAKLTKGLEKKREKAVKDLKKVMDEQEGSPFPGPDFNNKGYIAARDLIDRLRATVFKKLNDDELEEFRKTLADAFDLQLKEDLSENFDKVSGGIPYKVENGNAIISIPLPDDAKERIIKRAKENGYSASPNMAGGVTIRKKGLNEDEGTLNKIADMLSRKFDDLRFDVNTMSDRIDVRGSRSDLADFGEELQGKKIFDYEIFYIEEDPGERGAIVRIVKSDSISRGGVNEATVDYDFSEKELIRVLRQLKRGASTEVDMIRAFSKALGREITDDELMREEMDPKEMKTGTYVGKKVVIHMHGPETEWKVEFIDTGKIVDYVDVMANLKFDDGTTYMDYLKEKKNKADRCLRIARRKMPQSSAYRSGLIVKCRKGMIWKKEK